jgi:penicillin-binding protein 2
MTTQSTPHAKQELWRALVFYLALALAFSVLVLRLFGFQVLEFTEWKARAEENRTRTVSVQPSRGIIYDRRGFILARNVASFNIIITPAGLPDDLGDIQEIYRQLSELTGIPVNSGTVEDAKNFSECTEGPGITQWVELGDSLAPYRPVRIDCNVSEDMARTVGEKAVDWPGVDIEIQPVRDYPTGSLTSAVIGFLGPIPASAEQAYVERGFELNRDKVGYSGLEAYFNDNLAGVPGKSVVEVDVAGQVLRNLEPPIKAQAGDNLILTIDTRLQELTETALIGEINRLNLRAGRIFISSGAAIAMNPKTGEILSMVSYPSFENNRLARFIPAYYYNQLVQDPRKPLLNHAVSAEYPPGSVFKLAAALGALNEGIVTTSTIVETPGKLTLKESFSPSGLGFEREFVDWVYKNGENPGGFGSLNFYQCIAYSSDVCFYKLGGGYKDEIPEGLNIHRISQYARALGYGQQSGIELLGEARGLVPVDFPQWKRINQGENWSTGDTYIATMGQGNIGGTPLQVLISTAAIANNGKLMQPTLIREITNEAGKPLIIWRDNDGDVYRPCDVTDKDGNPISGWCDSGYNINNNLVYSLCEQKNANDELVDGWCSTDEQNKPIFQEGAWQISPFQGGHMKWDITVDKKILDYECESSYCSNDDGDSKAVAMSAVKAVQEGMRLAVTDVPLGTLSEYFLNFPIAVAGKTGTAEYCDDVARLAKRCDSGKWPAHAWTVAYAPYDDPEIVVVVFGYNGTEGSTTAAPVIEKIMKGYFCLKSIDQNPSPSNGCE